MDLKSPRRVFSKNTLYCFYLFIITIKFDLMLAIFFTKQTMFKSIYQGSIKRFNNILRCRLFPLILFSSSSFSFLPLFPSTTSVLLFHSYPWFLFFPLSCSSFSLLFSLFFPFSGFLDRGESGVDSGRTDSFLLNVYRILTHSCFFFYLLLYN